MSKILLWTDMAIFEDTMADLVAQAIPVMLQRGPESNYLVDRSSKSQELSVLGIHRSVTLVFNGPGTLV